MRRQEPGRLRLEELPIEQRRKPQQFVAHVDHVCQARAEENVLSTTAASGPCLSMRDCWVLLQHLPNAQVLGRQKGHLMKQNQFTRAALVGLLGFVSVIWPSCTILALFREPRPEGRLALFREVGAGGPPWLCFGILASGRRPIFSLSLRIGAVGTKQTPLIKSSGAMPIEATSAQVTSCSSRSRERPGRRGVPRAVSRPRD